MATPSIRTDAPNSQILITTASGGVITLNFPDRSSDVTLNLPWSGYSATETEVGSFLGATLYRKVVTGSALPNDTSATLAHSITGLATMVSISGVADNATNQLPLPYVSASDLVSLYCDDTNINIVTNADLSAYTTSYFILEYTKA